MSQNILNAQRWGLALQNNYGTPQISLDHGVGSEVWDVDGKRYIDMLAGIATNILGHANLGINKAIRDQSERLTHVSNFYSHESGIALAEKLRELTGDKQSRIFFCNSGAEANEAAFKIARLTGRRKIVATHGAFHGRTMGALSLTGQPAKQKPFKPLLAGIKHIPFDDIAAAKKAISKRVAAFIVEPIQGENGVIVPSPNYLKAIREFTQEKGVLLILDCVQTGMGRTGNWFGFEESGIEPDVITLAKGLGAGLPLAAMITLSGVANGFGPGSHGSTFGGSPISCAAALAAISQIEDQSLLSKVKQNELTLKIELSKVALVESVRGSGLLIGVELKEPIAKEMVSDLVLDGVLANATNESTIRLAPALNIEDSLILEFIEIFRKVAKKYER